MTFKIAVDDGHGIETKGKQTPSGYKENEFNHFTKEYLIAELKYNKFEIIDCSPTREDNSLQDRVQREIKGKADIAVSIHFNAMGNKWQDKVGGIETYYHDGSTKGQKLAQLVHVELIKGTPLKDRKVKKDTLLYTKGLYFLRCTKSPAILVECGFMDNIAESLLMRSIEYRKECSKEIAKGICKYFNVSYKDKDAIIKPVKKYIYKVCAGAFENEKNAINQVEKLKEKGFDSYYVKEEI